MALKLHTSEEKALKAIVKSEASRRTYRNIKNILGVQQSTLTQVEIPVDPSNSSSSHDTLTKREAVESHILVCNWKHSLQALSTPFFNDPALHSLIDPDTPDNKLQQLLDGSCLSNLITDSTLSESERQWIISLQQIIESEISLSLSIDNYKHFFRVKQEHTASSPLGRHFGHYKTLLECIPWGTLLLPQLIIDIAYIYLSTASPLQRWQTASQVVLEKGKGRYIEHLRIIQLCEEGLNFVLHVIWGSRLIHHACDHNALNPSQFALPSQTCNNAVLNKVLFFDHSRQTLSSGVFTDFDAKAAFDRVIAGLSVATCKRVGLPIIIGHFMFHLLKHMTFHLVTGFGASTETYNNTIEGITGQGVLQGSSSAAPIFFYLSLMFFFMHMDLWGLALPFITLFQTFQSLTRSFNMWMMHHSFLILPVLTCLVSVPCHLSLLLTSSHWHLQIPRHGPLYCTCLVVNWI